MLANIQAACRPWIAVIGLLTLSIATGQAAPPPQAAEAKTPRLAAPITKGQRVFTCGHSFHVWVPGIVTNLCKLADIPDHVQVGVSSIGGSRVIQHWDIAADKNKAKDALRTGKVDVLTLSPIFLPDAGIENFTRLALEHNPDIRIVVQPIWLRWDIYEPTMKRPAKVDHNAMTGEELRKRHEPYLQEMDAYIRELNQKLGKTVLYEAPAPQALIALREKVIAGQAPGLKAQADLFTDGLGHGTAPLKALVAYVNFAVIYRRSPVGLPTPAILKQAKLGDQEASLNRLLQELAWQAVLEHPLSGVRLADAGANKAPAKPKPDDARAVKAAIGYLSQQQQMDGAWKTEANGYQEGVSALCTLALLNGGVDVRDERLKLALHWQRGHEPERTYSLALQTIVYCRTQAPEDKQRIRRNVTWLAAAQAKNGDGKGGWSYVQASGGRGDGSCTRFAIWALDAARRADVKVPESVWRANADYWLDSQLEDGAWAYLPKGGQGTVTMTLAGIACLAAIKDAVADESLHARIDQSVKRAWKRHDQWYAESQPSYLKSHSFRLYAYQSLGQAATRTAHVKIGDAAWRPSATRLLLAEQQADSGSWSGPSFGRSQPVVNTSVAILFLTEK